MITITETVTQVDENGKYGRCSDRYFDVDTLSALHRLMLVLSDSSANVAYLDATSLTVKFREASSVVYEYRFSGPFAELRPVLLVARQYDAQQRAVGNFGCSLTLRFNHEGMSDLLGDPVVPVGKRYDQPWGDMFERQPLKLAVILGLSSESGPNHVREDLIHKPLMALIDELLSNYLYRESDDYLRQFRLSQTTAN